MYTDTIADYMTRIRNAAMAKHLVVDIPYSKVKEKITVLLKDNGYIREYKVCNEDVIQRKTIRIALKYDKHSKDSAIKSIVRVSKSGLRKYVGKDDIPSVINGLGIAIMSTSLGIISNKDATKKGVGGEVMGFVY